MSEEKAKAGYRVTATITWEFESNEDPHPAVKSLLGTFPSEGLVNFHTNFLVEKIKPKVDKIRLGEFTQEDIFPYLTRDETKREYEIGGVKHFVKMNSPRYFLFRECLNCVACGLRATRIFLECHHNDNTPHFNFYGEEEEKLVLFTKDHIHAKSCGGDDRHSNYQTMCLTCNNMKAHHNLTLEHIRELRSIYDENKGKLSKKKLFELMEEAKSQMLSGRPQKVSGKKKQKSSPDALLTNCDINLYRGEKGIVGKFVYDIQPKGFRHVGGVKKGTILTPLLVMGEYVMCDLGGNEVVLMDKQLVR